MPTPAPTASVEVIGLVKRYGNRVAVDDLSFNAHPAAVTALLGPNGAGKTTTLECCEGLRRPDGGSVRVLGLDPTTDARTLRPRVGVMLQDGGLPATVPAGEVLRHVAAMYGTPLPVGDLAERLGIDRFSRTTVRRLSGGERQRLALAAALVGRPEVLFLDEPSAGMDPAARLAVWDLVTELRAAGTAIVLTTHQIAEAEALADRVVIVDDGQVLADGTTTELVGDGDLVRVMVGAADEAAREGLASTLAGWTRPGPPAVTLGVGCLEVRAPATPPLLHAITGWAASHDVAITSMTTGRRTLEDVFLDLTGRRLR
ncbi:MAG: ABC transporter ATP-binding protein [Cellulomonadaceae bacterium]|nr:ABC transporter ATP-binding protein [Cellulomonadaceae bacterium]